jgi:integrase
MSAHGVTPERKRKGGSLTDACRQRLAEIDLHVHDLRHEAASRRYFDDGWTLFDVSQLLGHTDVSTTERYLGVKDDGKRQQELVARPRLALVR